MQQVVGLVGIRGSGKDTAAQFLIAQGWQRAAFADGVYMETAHAFGVSVGFLQRRETKELPLPELALCHCSDDVFVDCVLAYDKSDERITTRLHKPRSPREILQLWGTEYCRTHYGDDYWRAQVANIIRSQPDVNFVITDVRFPDEARLVEKELGGELGRIIRPGLGGADDKTLLHASEVAMRDYPIEKQFVNEEGPEGLAKFRQAVLAAFHREG